MIRRIPRVNELEEDERCAKHEEALANKIVEEEQNTESTSSEEKVPATKEEELPFEDVLADQRRQYTPRQQYVQLIYNDLVKYFVKKWEGSVLRKTVQSPDRSPAETKKESKLELTEDDVKTKIDKRTSNPDWKLDVMVEVVFVNDNTYTGRVSKTKMEGQGIYRWHHGSQYKGSFENNKIQGKGNLEWQDYVRYEGDLEDGYYHGRGTMVDTNYKLLYIGEWKKGRKHGKGYCRYAENDSYDGNWVMGKREGFGCRLYTNGARYVGDWKNNLRHGRGTMIWPSGDCYRGEWNQGQMHGYGEYTWDRFFNGSVCRPQDSCYIGQWHRGTRNGKGNNGDITEGDPLFLNDILRPNPPMSDYPEKDEDKKYSKDIDGNYLDDEFVTKPRKILEARMTSVLKPEQCPSLSYYIDRLRETNTNSSLSIPLLPGKCKTCKEFSCRCITESIIKQSSRDQDLSSVDVDKKNGNISKRVIKTSNADLVLFEKEEDWACKCISMHMPQIRKVYGVYSKIFCNESPKCRLSMCRLSLWQLWRDCKIHERNLSLVQIDKYLAANRSTLMENPHCPNERIRIWQLIHALLEVSWHLYTKKGDVNEEGYPGRLANGLHKLLVNDIYPNFGSFTGIMCGPERDLLPTHTVYQLYKTIGESHSVRQLLKAICRTEKISERESPQFSMPTSLYFNPEARDHVNAEENLSNPSSDEPMPRSKPGYQLEKLQSLLLLRKLGVTELVQIMSVTCPSIKEPESNIIINSEYKLTFLEFLEIFIKAGKRLIWKKKLQRETDRIKAEGAETTSIVSVTKGIAY